MALYEYQCATCGKKTEVIQSFRDAPLKKCPHCGGALRKLLSSPAFKFKGSGFYATDYGNVGGKDGENSSKGKDGESSSKEKTGESSSSEKEAGGDAKPAGGAEPKSAGDPAKEKKDAGDSSKERKDSGGGAAKEPAKGRTSYAPSEKKKSVKD